MMPHIKRWLCVSLLGCYCSVTVAAEGKLLATPGVAQVEGAGGGGLVPWAQLAGYAEKDEIAFTGFCSRAQLEDYRLDACGVQMNLFDRVEFSAARQNFDVDGLGLTLSQEVYGAKLRLHGDIVYSRLPQISLGLQHKRLRDPAVAGLLGAREERGTDWYLAASKLHLGALAGYNWFWNVSARHSNANQLGLLGFGGPEQGRRIQLEASTAVFLSPHVAVGAEYRQKPDNLGIGEQDWRDVFVAWFPSKRVSVTAAWLNLGSIAGSDRQQGWYLSVMGGW